MSDWVPVPLPLEDAPEQPNDVTPGASYVSMAQLVNFMLRVAPKGSPEPFQICHVPGLSTTNVTTPGSGAIRGMCYHESTARVFVIAGTEIYYASALTLTSWTLVPVGSMPGSLPCRMVDAETHVVAVDGTNARAITAAESFACSRGNFSDVSYQDGITTFVETGSDSFYASDVGDPTTINALAFTTVDALTGACVGLIQDHRETFVFKGRSIEYFQNVGASPFPFARSQPGVVERGAFSPRVAGVPAGRRFIAKSDHSLFFVGDDLRAYRMRGYQPEAISTPWVDRLLKRSLFDPGGDIHGTPCGFAFKQDGTLWYMIGPLSYQSARFDAMLVCDVERRLWHIRRSPLNGGGAATSHTIAHAIELPGASPGLTIGTGRARVLVAGLLGAPAAGTSTLYLLDPDAYNDSGASGQTARVMTLPKFAPPAAQGRRVIMHELEMNMQKAGAAGTFTLSWSDDGGTTFNTPVSGTPTDSVCRWHRLGSFRHRIFRVNAAIASPLAIMGMRARVEVCA